MASRCRAKSSSLAFSERLLMKSPWPLVPASKVANPHLVAAASAFRARGRHGFRPLDDVPDQTTYRLHLHELVFHRREGFPMPAPG